MKKILIFIAALACSSLSIAESVYVNDNLSVMLRTGPSTDFKIIRGVRSGTKLDVLEQDDVSGYSKVRLQNGNEGFILTRYLTSEPVARIKLDQAERQLSKVNSENKVLKEQLDALRTEHTELSGQYQKASSSLDSTTQELTNIKNISSNAIHLDQRNRELRESNEHLRNELELLQTENMRLKDKTESNMMLVGGGLVTLGVIIALLLPLLKPSKKNDTWA